MKKQNVSKNPFVAFGSWCSRTFKWLFDFKDWTCLLRSIPALVVGLFIVSVVCMNLLANRELFNYGFIALDCGFTLSWISFLMGDCIARRFGPKAATKISILAIIVNLVLTGIFALLMLTPGSWGAAYDAGDNMDIANCALNSTFSGTWYVVFGSTVAMLISSIINAILNWSLGKALHDNNGEKITYKKFAIRSFVSTGIAQFIDNLIFATLVSKIFFGWSWTAVIMCSLIGACFELLCEVILSPVGYRMSKKWQEQEVGKEYLEYQEKKNG